MRKKIVSPGHRKELAQEMVASTHFGASEAAGAALLLGVGIVAWMARRRAPVATFGVLWCAVSLLPVSNVFIPTGILLAERTTFGSYFANAAGTAISMQRNTNIPNSGQVMFTLQPDVPGTSALTRGLNRFCLMPAGGSPSSPPEAQNCVDLVYLYKQP